MFIKIAPAWDTIRESEATPEQTYDNRRQLLRKICAAGIGTLLTSCLQNVSSAASEEAAHVPEFWVRKWSDLFPAKKNESFTVERGVTDESIVTSYNNFYEFSTIKERVQQLVDDFSTHPWSVEIKGQVGEPGRYDLDDLARMGDVEERLYHFRCVEAWSANIPWTGFPFARLIDKVRPHNSAKFVRFVSVHRPNEMPGQRDRSYPWPYYEGLTMEEAQNELALLAIGLYGHPLNKQNGAPVRLVLPWKYGFKSIKSIVRIEFVRKQPGTLWSDISSEYGFFANVNPNYAHPRWSQASERFLNTGERIPTKIYNGYGDYVSHLYDENDRRYFF